MPNKIRLGIPWTTDEGGYNWFEAFDSNTNNSGHAASRNPITGRILKSENHPTFPKTVVGELEAGMHFYRDPQGNLYTSEQPMSQKYPYNMIYQDVDIPINMDWIKKRQAFVESGFKPNITNHKEASGLFQIRPIALKEYVNATNDNGDLSDPEYNKRVRDWYFNFIYNNKITQHDNQVEHLARTLAAYNWGLGNLSANLKEHPDNWLQYAPKETRDYVNFILYGDDIDSRLNENTYQKAVAMQQYLKSGGILLAKSGIYIKPENRGKFTALKKRIDKSSTWYKEHGTPEQKRMANFALNSKHWNHGKD